MPPYRRFPTGRRALGILGGMLLCSLGQGDTLAPADLMPNYGARMKGPFSGRSTEAALLPVWTRFPLRIVVMEAGPAYRADAMKSIARAAKRWEEATKAVPGGGVEWSVAHSRAAWKSDVVIELCGYGGADGYRAITLPQSHGQYLIRLEVVDENGSYIDSPVLERIVTHELGHALGISGHSPDPGDVMSLNVRCSDVSLADVNTLRLAYGGYLRRAVQPVVSAR